MSERALDDLTVVEVAEGVSGPYCGKLLGDLGADVIKVEPPSGDRSRRHGPFPGDVPDPERSGQFLYLNANKRSITLDLESAADRGLLHGLAATADILVVDLPHRQREALGLTYEALKGRDPGLIVTAISPFGAVGPYRDYAGNFLTGYHAGGLGWGTPHNEVTDRESQPPLVAGGYLADYITGITAAAVTTVALAYRDAHGVGQEVDLSTMESVANACRSSLGMLASNREPPPSRSKTGYPWVWRCKDGYVSIALQRDHWWVSLREMMGDPEWARSELFDTSPGRMENADVIEPLVAAWLEGKTKAELYKEALARQLPGFPVFSMPDLLADEQFQLREAFIDVEYPGVGAFRQPGPPARFSRTPATVHRAPPSLGQHTEEVKKAVETRRPAAPPVSHAVSPAGNQPLAGVRIADFGWIFSVPHATSWLGTFGAEVIRIESNLSPDTTRAAGLTTGADRIPGINRGMGFNSLNFGKKSVTLNLKDPRAVELAKDLVRISDVATENFVVGTMERAGLHYEALKAIRPDLIMLSGSTLGQTGPARKATGWGPNSMAAAGVPYLTGYPGGPPMSVDATFPDFLIGVQMAQAILAALHERRRTGKGQYIDVSMAETILATIPEAIIDCSLNGRDGERRGNRHPQMAPHGVYRCDGDDAWLAVAVTDDTQWEGLWKALGAPAALAKPEYRHAQGRLQDQDRIDREVEAWTRARSNYQAMHALQAHGVPAAPVLNAVAVSQDPQMQTLGYLVDVDHKEVGVRTIPGLPGRYSAMPHLDYRPTPLIGEHSEEVFCGLLGLSQERYRELVDEKVIH